MLRFALVLLMVGASCTLVPVSGAVAQERGDVVAETPDTTGYAASPTVSARFRANFLDAIRWSAGQAIRDQLAEAFAQQDPSDMWLDLVRRDGLTTGNVTDALAAYWALNWMTANRAYTAKIDLGAVQRQVRTAFANDRNFQRMGDQRRQELAEGYILNFLVQHAALSTALKKRETAILAELANAAVLRFRRQMGINLLALTPGPQGFGPAQSAD